MKARDAADLERARMAESDEWVRERLRDEFAMAALPCVLRDFMHRPPQADPQFFQKLQNVGAWIYQIADAALAARALPSKQSDPEPKP